MSEKDFVTMIFLFFLLQLAFSCTKEAGFFNLTFSFDYDFAFAFSLVVDLLCESVVMHLPRLWQGFHPVKLAGLLIVYCVLSSYFHSIISEARTGMCTKFVSDVG